MRTKTRGRAIAQTAIAAGIEVTPPRDQKRHSGTWRHALIHEAAHKWQCGVAVQVGRHSNKRCHDDRPQPLAAEDGRNSLCGNPREHQAFEDERECQPLG